MEKWIDFELMAGQHRVITVLEVVLSKPGRDLNQWFNYITEK